MKLPVVAADTKKTHASAAIRADAVVRLAAEGAHQVRPLLCQDLGAFPELIQGHPDVLFAGVELAVRLGMIDRLVHHADVIALKGNSYRLENHDLGRIPTPTED